MSRRTPGKARAWRKETAQHRLEQAGRSSGRRIREPTHWIKATEIGGASSDGRRTRPAASMVSSSMLVTTSATGP